MSEIKTINPIGYLKNGQYVSFEKMKGTTNDELDTIIPLYDIAINQPTISEDELRLASHEREILVQAFDKVRQIFEGREWVTEGRGNYRYDDDRYKQEVRFILDEFKEIKDEAWKNIKSKSFEYRDRIIKEFVFANPQKYNEHLSDEENKNVWKHDSFLTGLLNCFININISGRHSIGERELALKVIDDYVKEFALNIISEKQMIIEKLSNKQILGDSLNSCIQMAREFSKHEDGQRYSELYELNLEIQINYLFNEIIYKQKEKSSQVAIEFAEWIKNNDYKPFTNNNKGIINWLKGGMSVTKTSKQLFKDFMTEKNKTNER